ncbi:acyl carrier protein [Derxia lacustris]|uniref:acyl carrier protein n=1 Tax=Derxia lacustris TaxID=764842 RepID=UPI0015934536|nr:acyl carrier protein [Derxia lacustris]
MNQHDSIRDKLKDFVAREADLAGDDIDDDANLGDYGVDSSAAVALIGEMEDAYGVELSPTLIYEHPTLDALADAIGQSVADARKDDAAAA